MSVRVLLSEAERLLHQNPRDDIHDLSHHLRVWETAQIISKSINEKIDKNVLQIATMWHDVMITDKSLSLGEDGITSQTIDYLSNLMDKTNQTAFFKDAVINAIRHHNFFTKKQTNVEGKILFDADKLDALAPIRYRKIIWAIKNKKIPRIQTFLYANAAKIWLRTMRGRYHFEISRKIHDERINTLLRDEEAIRVAKGLGVDIASLVK